MDTLGNTRKALKLIQYIQQQIYTRPLAHQQSVEKLKWISVGTVALYHRQAILTVPPQVLMH